MIDAAVEVLPVGLLVLAVLVAMFVAGHRAEPLEVRDAHCDCTFWRADTGDWWARCACGLEIDGCYSEAAALDWWNDHCEFGEVA